MTFILFKRKTILYNVKFIFIHTTLFCNRVNKYFHKKDQAVPLLLLIHTSIYFIPACVFKTTRYSNHPKSIKSAEKKNAIFSFSSFKHLSFLDQPWVNVETFPIQESKACWHCTVAVSFQCSTTSVILKKLLTNSSWWSVIIWKSRFVLHFFAKYILLVFEKWYCV